MATVIALIGSCLLIASLLLNLISFLVPFWLYNANTDTRLGLFAECTFGKCIWFFQDDHAWENYREGWHKACQGLFGFGLIAQLLICLVANCHLCSGCRKGEEGKPKSLIFGALLFIPGIMIAVSIILFGVRTHNMWGTAVELDWSYHVGIAGLALLFASALSFLVDACYRRSRIGYRKGDVV